MNKWTRPLTAAIAALATAVIGAPPGHAQPATGSGTVVARHVASEGRVVNLRVGEHPRFDRVVIDVRGALPGRREVRYVHRLSYDGSGAPVPLHGRRFLNVTLYQATTVNRHGRNVYKGPLLQQYSMPVLRGVAFTGDFEGYVSFGIALRRHVAYHVRVLHSPNRIVIDLHH
jgi:hypothetical protein